MNSLSMQTHQLQSKHKLKSKKRVGRGGKKGTYSGRGIKGQSARSGRKMVPIIRELIKRYPKLKGYRSSVPDNRRTTVSTEILDKKFSDGDTVNPKSLIEKGIFRAVKNQKVKILNEGSLSKNLTIENCEVSKAAKTAIEKAGGTIVIQN